MTIAEKTRQSKPFHSIMSVERTGSQVSLNRVPDVGRVSYRQEIQPTLALILIGCMYSHTHWQNGQGNPNFSLNGSEPSGKTIDKKDVAGGEHTKNMEIRAAQRLRRKHQWGENDTSMNPKEGLNYFKVVYEPYHLGWIKRWCSAEVGKHSLTPIFDSSRS